MSIYSLNSITIYLYFKMIAFTSFVSALVFLFAFQLQLNVTVAQQRGSQRKGYNDATKLWETGTFQCNLSGVLDFWTAVKTQTFQDCDKDYFLNQQRIESCKEGAATFVREKADSCSTNSDCEGLGNLAAQSVSQEFCQLETDAPIPSDFFPPACQSRANRQCNVRGQFLIQALVNQQLCGTNTLPLAENQKLALQSECRTLVRNWSRKSLLPFP